MEKTRKLLSISAIALSILFASYGVPANFKSSSIIAYYDIFDPPGCVACEVHDTCTLTTPGIRCLCFVNGFPALKLSNCTVELYRSED